MAPSALTPPPEEYNIALNHKQYLSDCSLGSISNNGASSSKQLIGAALKSRVEAIDHDICDVGDEDTFFVADLGEVYRQHLRWKKNLARVKPHYGKQRPYLLPQCLC
jgi:ornithine decarboxylase